MPSVFHLITINSILALISFYPEMLKRDHIKYISDTNACLKDQLTSSWQKNIIKIKYINLSRIKKKKRWACSRGTLQDKKLTEACKCSIAFHITMCKRTEVLQQKTNTFKLHILITSKEITHNTNTIRW